MQWRMASMLRCGGKEEKSNTSSRTRSLSSRKNLGSNFFYHTAKRILIQTFISSEIFTSQSSDSESGWEVSAVELRSSIKTLSKPPIWDRARGRRSVGNTKSISTTTTFANWNLPNTYSLCLVVQMSFFKTQSFGLHLLRAACKKW